MVPAGLSRLADLSIPFPERPTVGYLGAFPRWSRYYYAIGSLTQTQ